jgi:hypothetical protein
MKSRCVSYHELARIEAEEGSTGLRIAIERLFDKFEHEHRLLPGSARVLLPAGWGGFAR